MDTAAANRGNLEVYLAQSAVPSAVPGNGYGLVHASAFLQRLPDFQPRKALLVAGSTTLNRGDSAVRNRLQGMGYAVTVKDDTSSAASDATGMDIVLLSSTAESADVNSKFCNVAVPVIVWEDNLFDDMKMTGVSHAYASGQSAVAVNHSAHPMAAGFSGAVAVYTSSDGVSWGVPSSSAISLAGLASDSTRSVIFGYEQGAAMVGLTAPARRVGFFLAPSGASKLTSAGAALFDAAVAWAVTDN
jgi:hypothetical protein